MSFSDAAPEYEFIHDDALVDAATDADGDATTDDDHATTDGDDDAAPVAAPSGAAARKKRVGATAAMFTALAMAYREVFEPEKVQEIVMEVEADEPFLDGPVQVFLEPGNPRAGRIVVRRA